MKSMLISCAVALSLVLAPTHSLIAQSSLPSLGSDTALSLGSERRMGDEIARAIYKDPEYVADPILDAYMSQIMQPLYTAALQRGELSPQMSDQFAWRLLLVRDKSVNAFALPGGYLGVHLGLLALVETPDELASVMAHEITHVTQRHIARGMSKQAAATPWLIAGILIALLAARSNDSIANAAMATTQAGAIQNQLNFTREMEREADRIGFTLMAPAGYAPSGFVAMFNKLGHASRLADSGSFPYLRSHPLSTDRVADMTNRIGEFEVGKNAKPATTASASALLLHQMMAARARALADLSVDAQKLLLTRAGIPQADMNLQIASLYAGALAALQLKELAKAKTLHAQLLTYRAVMSGTESHRLMRMLGVQIEALQAGQVGSAVHSTLTLSLSSDNRAEMLLAAQLAIQSHHPQQIKSASERLRAWTSVNPHDADAWSMLASAQIALNQRVRAAMAQAESKRAHLDDSAALAGYLAAQTLIRQDLSADAVDTAIVDSKVRELQRLVRERLLLN